MEIQYFGHFCFRLRGKKALVMTDPFNSERGVKFPKITADIVTVSQNQPLHNNSAAVLGGLQRKEPFVISAPGEYEVAGVSIMGIAGNANRNEKRTLYIINLDDLKLVHLGDLDQVLTEKQLEEINGVDILFVSEKAKQVIFQVEPKIAVLMNFKNTDDFLKELEEWKVEKADKLILAKENLPAEKKVVILNARA